MPTANGTLTRVSANRIIAVFIVDDIQQTFNAAISPALQPFTSNQATLTYNSEGDLTSTRHFSGVIGTTTFKLTLDNGPIIEGALNIPGVSPASTVDGSGAWEAY
jgi:hypothetical protein